MRARRPLAVVLVAALGGAAQAEDHAGHHAPGGHEGHAGHAGHGEHGDHTGHEGHTGHEDHAGHEGHAERAGTQVGMAHAEATGVTDAHDHGSHPHGGDDHGSILGGHHHHGGGSSIAATIGVLAATYDARLFSGDYQGMVLGGRWSRGRFGVAATMPAYRLQKNGKVVSGIGDLMVHGHATAFTRGRLATGFMAMASAPTGDGEQGLGMGHVMVMADAWGAWTAERVAVTGSFGYAAALGDGTVHAEHGGVWPLVEPMNARELTFGGGGMIALARTLATGARLWGATPIGDGTTRLSGAWRVAWRAGRVETSAELQGGLVGDPFGVRGVIETSIRFR